MPDFESVTTWISAFAELTFPVIIAGYLLFVVNRSVEGLKITVQNLTLEMKVGLAVLLHKLDAEEDFNAKLKIAQADALISQEKKKK